MVPAGGALFLLELCLGASERLLVDDPGWLKGSAGAGLSGAPMAAGSLDLDALLGEVLERSGVEPNRRGGHLLQLELEVLGLPCTAMRSSRFSKIVFTML